MTRIGLALIALCVASVSHAQPPADCSRGAPDVMIAGCTKLLAQKPSAHNRGVAHFNRGLAYLARSEWQLAINDFTEALKIRPNDARAYRSRASALTQLRRDDEALADLSQAIKFDPRDYPSHRSLAQIYISRKDFLGAIAVYSEAMNHFPKESDLYLRRGMAWANAAAPQTPLAQEYERATADFTKAIELNPKNAGAYVGRGLLHARQQKRDEAIADFREVVKISPGHTGALDALKRLGVSP